MCATEQLVIASAAQRQQNNKQRPRRTVIPSFRTQTMVVPCQAFCGATRTAPASRSVLAISTDLHTRPMTRQAAALTSAEARHLAWRWKAGLAALVPASTAPALAAANTPRIMLVSSDLPSALFLFVSALGCLRGSFYSEDTMTSLVKRGIFGTTHPIFFIRFARRLQRTQPEPRAAGRLPATHSTRRQEASARRFTYPVFSR